MRPPRGCRILNAYKFLFNLILNDNAYSFDSRRVGLLYGQCGDAEDGDARYRSRDDWQLQGERGFRRRHVKRQGSYRNWTS